jgi:hypothetical protein
MCVSAILLLLSDWKNAKKGKKKLETMQITIKMGSLKMSRHLVRVAAFLNPTALLALSMTRQAVPREGEPRVS